MKKIIILLTLTAIVGNYSFVNAQSSLMKKMAPVIKKAAELASTIEQNTSVNQPRRTKISDGVYLVHYGSVQVIEDDNKQMSIRVEVKDSGKRDSQTGEKIYDLFCNNKFVKSVNIWLLSEAINAALKATVWGAAVPSPVVKIAVGAIYESVCEYYR